MENGTFLNPEDTGVVKVALSSYLEGDLMEWKRGTSYFFFPSRLFVFVLLKSSCFRVEQRVRSPSRSIGIVWYTLVIT